MSKKQESRDRPLSPHLQVYKPQMTSVLSITHRFSLVKLFFILPFFVAWLYLGVFMPKEFAQINELFGTTLGQIILIGTSFVLFYNLLHGIRHTFWDYAIGFELATINKTAWLIILGSIALTLITWCGVYK